ncbi:MAG: MATE family efflux transporter [Planctomycetaceae bacterium]|nr:MATE family efflux transporter [Planctomycetaceae bacterium]
MFGQVKDLTRGSPLKQTLLFAVPLLIGNVFQQFYNMADMIIVGRTISTTALAAIGATGAIAFLVVGFSFGLTSGFTVITAQRYGAGDTDGVRRSIATAIVLSVAVTVVVTGLSVYTAYPLFELMDTPADIIDDAYRYIVVIYAGTIATVFFNLFSGILRALGDSLTPLLFLVLACIVNIILDYVLIVYFHMGVAGAGWATIVAQAFSVILCLFYSLKRFPIMRLRRDDWRLDAGYAWKHLAIGLSMGAQMAIIAVGTIVLQIGINRLGTDSIKAFSAAVKIDQLATQPLLSLGIAVATFTAQNFGAGKYARIREGAKKCSFVAVGMSLAGCLTMILTGRWLLSLFGIGLNEPDVVREAVLYLNTTSLFYFMLGLLFVLRNLLQGMGKNVMPTAAAGAEVVVRVVATFTFLNWWGFWGVCIVNPVAWTGAVAMLTIGYFQAARDFRRHGPPTYESVILNYDAQAKFGAPMENVPMASVRLTAPPQVRNGDKESIRFL